MRKLDAIKQSVLNELLKYLNDRVEVMKTYTGNYGLDIYVAMHEIGRPLLLGEVSRLSIQENCSQLPQLSVSNDGIREQLSFKSVFRNDQLTIQRVRLIVITMQGIQKMDENQGIHAISAALSLAIMENEKFSQTHNKNHVSGNRFAAMKSLFFSTDRASTFFQSGAEKALQSALDIVNAEMQVRQNQLCEEMSAKR